MTRYVLFCLVLLFPGLAAAQTALPVMTAHACRLAMRVAERSYGIPPNLLAAIGRVESGRRDPATGAEHAWPWTINMDGAGLYYDSKAQAVAGARAMRPAVTRSIDVGCMQISLTAHPDAFPSLETAFDPAANVDYGARFLLALFQKTGAWAKAVELYHSATKELGQPYQARVFATWREEIHAEPGRFLLMANSQSMLAGAGYRAVSLRVAYSARPGALIAPTRVFRGMDRPDG